MFAAAFAALTASHHVADHWVQTNRQATDKELPGWVGRRACAAHVGTYLTTQAVALAAVCAATGARPRPSRVAAALAISGLTHYVADRRAPLRRLAAALGKCPVWMEQGNGIYTLDQSWHLGWLGVAALMLAERRPAR